MMRVCIDVEANSLVNPTNIWVIVCKDLDTGKFHIFREVTKDDASRQEFLSFAQGVSLWVGHNWLEYDYPVLNDLCGLSLPDVAGVSLDTLVLSRLVDYSRAGGHSIESYGEEFGYPKSKFSDYTKYSKELEERCVVDCEIGSRIYTKFASIHGSDVWQPAIRLEQSFQLLVNQLHSNGFCFNSEKASKLLETVTKELGGLDERISKAFPPRTELVKVHVPKNTKHGTISRTSIPRGETDLTPYQEGAAFSQLRWREFNPSSHKQLIEVLARAGWKPIDKTQTHIDTERELNHLKYKKQRDKQLDIAIQLCKDKIVGLEKTGWKINETNLGTLPDNAPEPARLLAKRILLESRRRSLTEWLGLVESDGRIHCKFQGLGAWTGRMAHQRPNVANIPNEFDTSGKVKLLGRDMRQLWIAPKRRLLVGVDAEGIQLRIFAHYINDPEFTKALVEGRKDDKTDPHSLNQRILGSVCKSRAAAKRYIYALLLGAGIGKLTQILECSKSECQEALDRLLERYTGFSYLKKEVIPADARRGYFTGLDGRLVGIPGTSQSERSHLCMSGYLQNGEAIIVKRWALKALPRVREVDPTYLLVNIIHDEKQGEGTNNVKKMIEIGEIENQAIREVGEELGLKCPLAGSFYNDEHRDYTIGTNWYQTH